MSDLFGNHIVGFPTRWLKRETHLRHIVTGVHSSTLGIDSTHLSLVITDTVKVSMFNRNGVLMSYNTSHKQATKAEYHFFELGTHSLGTGI